MGLEIRARKYGMEGTGEGMVLVVVAMLVVVVA